MKDRRVIFTIVTFIIGFMVAIQFQSNKEPTIRDTRDIRELRNELQSEQERHQQLVEEIEKNLSFIEQYEASLNDHEESVEQVLKQQVETLKKETGLTEIGGEGIILTVEPLFQDQYLGQASKTIPSSLLRFLVNELNFYGATSIAIGNERVVFSTAFREVNGMTRVNGRRIPPLPLEIKVLADDAEKLHNLMVVSESVDYFELENLKLTSIPSNSIELPAYDQTPIIRYLEEVKED